MMHTFAAENSANRRTFPGGPEGSERGFTLTDLLITLAVVGLLGATLATAMASTRPNTLAFQCLNNLRQLGSAWTMYSDDYVGALVYNRDGASAGNSGDPSWVGGWLDYSSSTDNTNTDKLINHARYPGAAFLGPYLKTASVFKCPADKSLYLSTIPRVRSVSLNNFMGQNARSFTAPTAYTVYTKISQIGSPANLFLILDEREDSINDGLYFTNPDTRYNMVDYPASYHEGSANFGFVDGHGDTHKWLDSRTATPINPGQFLPLNVMLTGDVDVDWLQQHASELAH
jgi:prepilin-type processing-associated H-X9-DG protein